MLGRAPSEAKQHTAAKQIPAKRTNRAAERRLHANLFCSPNSELIMCVSFRIFHDSSAITARTWVEFRWVASMRFSDVRSQMSGSTVMQAAAHGPQARTTASDIPVTHRDGLSGERHDYTSIVNAKRS